MSLTSKIVAAITFRLKYVRFFGPIRTARIQLARLTRRKWMTISLPGYDDLYLRPGTSDAKTMIKIFGDQEYDLPYPNDDARFIIDAGANVGYAAVWFSKRFPRALILAVEAEASNHRILQFNQNANIVPIHAALWPRMEFVRISNPDAGKWAFRVQEWNANGGDHVQGMTVDHLMEVYGRANALPRLDILKLDIESAEKELFEGDTAAWLPQVDSIVIELHDWLKPGCSMALHEATVGHFRPHTRKGENLMMVRSAAQ